MRRSLLSDFEVGIVGEQNAGKSCFLFQLNGQARVQFGQEKNTRFPLIFRIGEAPDSILVTDYPGFQDSGRLSEKIMHFGLPVSSAIVVFLSFRNANTADNLALLDCVDRLSSCEYLVCLNKADEVFRAQVEQIAMSKGNTQQETSFAARLRGKRTTQQTSKTSAQGISQFEEEAAEVMVSRFHELLSELRASMRPKARFWMTSLLDPNTSKDLTTLKDVLNKRRGSQEVELKLFEHIADWVFEHYEKHEKTKDISNAL